MRPSNPALPEPFYGGADGVRSAFLRSQHADRGIADGKGVSDDVWADALVTQIIVINAFNRLNVHFGRPGGDYVVGQFG